MNSINIRPARLSDLSTLYDFEQGIIKAERPFDPTLKPDPISYYDLKELIESAQALVTVAEVDGELVASGYAKIRRGENFHIHDRYAYLGFMFVKPSHRGQGIITKILNELRAWSTSQGINEIRLEVYEDNQAALRAYEKAGFKKHMVEMRISVD